MHPECKGHKPASVASPRAVTCTVGPSRNLGLRKPFFGGDDVQRLGRVWRSVSYLSRWYLAVVGSTSWSKPLADARWAAQGSKWHGEHYALVPEKTTRRDIVRFGICMLERLRAAADC